MSGYQQSTKARSSLISRGQAVWGWTRKVGTGVHRFIIRLARMLSAVLAIIPVIGRMGQVRFWIAYVSVIYFLLFWITRAATALFD